MEQTLFSYIIVMLFIILYKKFIIFFCIRIFHICTLCNYWLAAVTNLALCFCICVLFLGKHPCEGLAHSFPFK